uniref:DNA 3'-5' helicase n=1 Tax=Aceria tosichella TaxID=561515 RepID=A0A6G1SNA2_9ACAR
MPSVHKENCRRISLKRKVFHKGGGGNKFKRFKRTPKCIRDNIENQVAREKAKDIYEFSDSEDDRADELGMGLEITDLPFLNDNPEDRQKELIALTQDSVRPFFAKESDYDESKLMEALAELKYTSFRPNQQETIKRILFGRSTLFISPTGSGKSLCYQLPALIYARYRKYITIVVSPLISLMEDQMANFPSSLRAVSLHSNHTRQQRAKAIGQLVNGEAHVVFVSPEAIVGGALELDDLRSLPPVGFVCIDEAHCLSEWSHNFRPAYLQFFSILREHLNIKTYLALTATSSRATSFAISKCLTINPDTDVIGATVVPDNLLLSVSRETNKGPALIKLLKSSTFRNLPSLIVYCNRRDETENIASLIRTSMKDYSSLIEVPERTPRGELLTDSQGNNQSPPKPHMKLTWDAQAYHAGLPSEVRRNIQRQFIKGEIRVVVATIAFGMGINKSNVRAIIHYDMPSSFESYVQEIGRAGRDGKTAQCHMFLRADMSDVFYQQRHIYSSVVEQANLKKIIDYVFKPCVCSWGSTEIKEGEEKNRKDKHIISSFQKTDFTDTPAQCDEDDLDDIEIDNSLVDNKQRPVKYIRESVVRKHRACHGNHEVAFGIDLATEATNLSPESIITYICQIQKAYPQLKIQQFAPFKSSCKVFCYKGKKQMQEVKSRCKAISFAMAWADRLKAKAGEKDDADNDGPSEITFDLAEVAFRLKQSVTDVIKSIKKVEWELVEETGRFRRSHVRVKFDVNSFHLRAVGDLNDQERDELHKFLIDSMKKYETVERNKVMNLYKTFEAHSLDVEKMGDKYSRLTTSMKLKKAVDSYFNPPDDQYLAEEANMHQKSPEAAAAASGEQSIEIPKSTIEAISKKAHDFILKHGTEHLPRSIAKIFQGISCPNYTAEHWGQNRLWWRAFPDVDFLKLEELIKAAWIRMN